MHEETPQGLAIGTEVPPGTWIGISALIGAAFLAVNKDDVEDREGEFWLPAYSWRQDVERNEDGVVTVTSEPYMGPPIGTPIQEYHGRDPKDT